MKKDIKILVVEDNNDINKLLCDMLKQSGYITKSAYSGTEALIYLKEYDWDMVLLDLMLPGMDGKELLANIRKSKPMPVIIISAKAVFTKANLFESVWGSEYLCDDNTINVHISNLRNKLYKAGTENEYIQTIWGIGYKLDS